MIQISAVDERQIFFPIWNLQIIIFILDYKMDAGLQARYVYTNYSTPSKGAELIAQMPERFSKGSILMDEGDFSMYLSVFAISFSTFFTLWRYLGVFFEAIQLP